MTVELSPRKKDVSLCDLSGKVLARNSFWNLIGQGTPLLVAIFAIPRLIDGLGSDRFGLLSLAWMFIGYFGLFDLGLSRALTQQVAEKIGEGREQEVAPLVWTSLLLMLVLGSVATLVADLLAPWLVYHILNIPERLQLETLRSFRLFALSIPVVVSTAGLRGVLEAQQRFGLVNAVRIPMGVFTFLGPLIVLPFSRSLFPVMGVLAVGRLIAWLAHLLLCLRVMPALRHRPVLERTVMAPLLAIGSWMTVTNTVGPLMVSLDRFLIGSMISVTAVAYYATPHEAVTKLLLISGAFAGVLFPAFAASFVQDRAHTALLFGRGVKYTFIGLFPITLLIVVFAHEGLQLWLGAEFARNSTRVLQWLAVGVFINSLAQTPFALVQGTRRPDLTAKLHLVELPFYLVTVWWLVGRYGINGAATAWVARVAVDMLFLFAMAYRVLPIGKPIVRRTMLTMGVALLSLASASLLSGIIVKSFFAFALLFVFMPLAWFLFLTSEERAVLRSCYGQVRYR